MNDDFLKMEDDAFDDPDAQELTSAVEDLKPSTPAEEEALEGILQILRDTMQVDFSHYRQPTVLRRLARRMSYSKMDSFESYLLFLKSNPEEVNVLYDDLLLFYTLFFRDPSAFDALKQIVFPHLVKNRAAKEPIRIWVPGCSTGEEVYSIAICLNEFLEEQESHATVQIFGTDLCQRHIDKARKGMYQENISKYVSPERLEKYFDRTSNGWIVAKHIRALCVFAEQDITQDPPFPGIDLVSCRNLLIYFDEFFQDRVIPMFHFALKPDGFLLLGSSETMHQHGDLFRREGQKSNIYRKCATSSRQSRVFPFGLPSAKHSINSVLEANTKSPKADDKRKRDLVSAQINEAILEVYAPPGILVDANMNIRQYSGDTQPYLASVPGEASLKLSKMAREGLALDIFTAVQEAINTQETVNKKNATFKRNDEICTINLKVMPMSSCAGETLFLVLFEQQSEFADTLVDLENVEDPDMTRENEAVLYYKQELLKSKKLVQSVIEEKDLLNQQLWAANEEVQSANEELQSVNEELEAGKEELEASNEELLTLNDELVSLNEELRESDRRSRAWLENSPVCTKILDIDFNLQYMSPSGIEALNLSGLDAVRGKQYPFHFYPDDFKNTMSENLRKAKASGEVIELEAPVVDVDGNELWFHSTIVPVNDDNDKLDYIIVVSLEITGRKTAEFELRKAHSKLYDLQRLESLGVLAGGVSHDLNNILGPLVSLPDMLIEEFEQLRVLMEDHNINLDSLNINDVGKSIALIKESALRAANTVGELRVLSGGGPRIFVSLDLRDIIEEMKRARELALLKASRPNLTLNISLEDGPLTINGDRDHLNRALFNLVRNAYDAIEGEGEVNISVGALELTQTVEGPDRIPAGDYVRLIVRDTGEGIDAESLPHIFEPYFTRKARTRSTGMGLGLSVVHGIVKHHDGYIDVTSKCGVGTTFEILIPATVSDAESANIIQEDLSGSEHVLVIDDEPGQLFIARRTLERQGYTVTFASTGREGVEKTKLLMSEGGMFDLILVDMIMEMDFDGLDTLQAIRKLNPDQKVIIVSGNSPTDRTKTAQGLGASWLEKPYTQEQLLQEVRLILGA